MSGYHGVDGLCFASGRQQLERLPMTTNIDPRKVAGTSVGQGGHAAGMADGQSAASKPATNCGTSTSAGNTTISSRSQFLLARFVANHALLNVLCKECI